MVALLLLKRLFETKANAGDVSFKLRSSESGSDSHPPLMEADQGTYNVGSLDSARKGDLVFSHILLVLCSFALTYCSISSSLLIDHSIFIIDHSIFT